MKSHSRHAMQQLMLAEVLRLVPFEGWSAGILEQASENLCVPAAMGRLLFPHGNSALIELLMSNIDKLMFIEYAKQEVKGLKIHEKILLCLELRFKILQNYKMAIRNALSFMTLPWNIGWASKSVWNTVDSIWYEAGNDQSVDFNYYTKRSLLAAVYSSSVLYWINDDSEGYTETIKFMERRIMNVLQIGKAVRSICS